MSISFQNTYVDLPEACYRPVQPEPSPQPAMIRTNARLAEQLQISPEWLQSDAALAVFAGNAIPDGAAPLASAYAGHQFGNWNPQLGDGRALLLGEVVTASGDRFDIQLKGSGRTPWSRGGDGKSPLGPVLREYIVSEAMSALGVPTTRALAAVATGDKVFRETGILPGAILTRVASSHIRIGTIQYFAARKDLESLTALVNMALIRHFPETSNSENKALALLNGVVSAQAKLIAHWQSLGFIHGVMNTDNMLLSGETIDYGPCAFMDTFKANTVYSSIDHQGRYAYGNQPNMAHWNLAQLAQALLPLLADDEEQAVELAQNAINLFPTLFLETYYARFAQKLGFETENRELTDDLLKLMEQEKLDFTLTFRAIALRADEHNDNTAEQQAVGDLPESLKLWYSKLLAAGGAENPDQMKAANPVFIPRNHQVEYAISAATTANDLSPFHRLCDVLETPFAFKQKHAHLISPPQAHEEVRNTFCGT